MRSHGTRGRYELEGCRCLDCREAVRMYRVGLRERAAANGGVYPGNITHGAVAYTNFGCRCDQCKRGHAERQERNKAARYARTAANGGIAPVEQHNESTYSNWGCSCAACRADAAQVKAARARARRSRAVAS